MIIRKKLKKMIRFQSFLTSVYGKEVYERLKQIIYQNSEFKDLCENVAKWNSNMQHLCFDGAKEKTMLQKCWNQPSYRGSGQTIFMGRKNRRKDLIDQ